MSTTRPAPAVPLTLSFDRDRWRELVTEARGRGITDSEDVAVMVLIETIIANEIDAGRTRRYPAEAVHA